MGKTPMAFQIEGIAGAYCEPDVLSPHPGLPPKGEGGRKIQKTSSF